MSDLLAVRDLGVSFGTGPTPVRAVDGVSFTLGEGETLGIVGESGSGKSVTALALLGLIEAPGRIDPASRILYRGQDLRAMRPEALRAVRGNEIAMVFQDPATSLNPVLRVGTQIAETIRAHRPVPAAQTRAHAVELLDLVGVPEPAHRVDAYPHELSGGMQQRVMLAIALACDPAVLIADEPTTALDVTIQEQVLALLADLKRRLGMAVILISHDIGIVTRLADRIAVMYGGQFVETAPTSAILTDAAHPYTRALLDATPRLDRPLARLPSIPGSVPNAARWPTGCRFHPRCRHAWEQCGAHEPTLASVEGDRQIRCWLTDEPERERP